MIDKLFIKNHKALFVLVGGIVGVGVLVGGLFILQHSGSRQVAQQPTIVQYKQEVVQPTSAPVEPTSSQIANSNNPSKTSTSGWTIFQNLVGKYQYSYPLDWKNNPPCSLLPSPRFCDGPQNTSSAQPKNIQDISKYYKEGYFEIDYWEHAACKQFEQDIKTYSTSGLKESIISINGMSATLHEGTILEGNGVDQHNFQSAFIYRNNNLCYKLNLRYTTLEQEKILNAILHSLSLLP